MASDSNTALALRPNHTICSSQVNAASLAQQGRVRKPHLSTDSGRVAWATMKQPSTQACSRYRQGGPSSADYPVILKSRPKHFTSLGGRYCSDVFSSDNRARGKASKRTKIQKSITSEIQSKPQQNCTVNHKITCFTPSTFVFIQHWF